MATKPPKTPKPHDWRPWADHPVVVIITIVAALITIYGFFRGNNAPITSTPSSTPSVSVTPTSAVTANIYTMPTPVATLTPVPTPAENQGTRSISIIEGVIFINGKITDLPSDIEHLESILGKVNRVFRPKSSDAPVLYFWDDVGIMGKSEYKSSKISIINVYFTRKFNLSSQFSPHKAYKGSVYIDGALLNEDSDIQEINKIKTGKLFENSNIQDTWKISYKDKTIYYSKLLDCSLHIEFRRYE